MSLKEACTEETLGVNASPFTTDRPIKEKWTDGRDPDYRSILEAFPAFSVLIERIEDGLPYEYLAEGNFVRLQTIEKVVIPYALREELIELKGDGRLGPGKFHLLVRMDSNASKSQRLFDARIRMAEANASMSAEEAKIPAIAFSSIDVSSQDGEGVLLNVLHAFGLQPKDPPRLSGQRGRLTIRVLCDWVEDSTLTTEH